MQLSFFSLPVLPPALLPSFLLLSSSPSLAGDRCTQTRFFICGLQKEKLEDIPHGFDQHTMKEHHMAKLHVREGKGTTLDSRGEEMGGPLYTC